MKTEKEYAAVPAADGSAAEQDSEWDHAETETPFPGEMRSAEGAEGTEGAEGAKEAGADTAAQLLDIQRGILRAERWRTVLIVLLAVPALVFGFFTTMSVKEMERKTDTVLKQVSGVSDEMEYLTGQLTSLNTLSSRLLGEVKPGALSDTLDGLNNTLSSISDAAQNVSKLDPEAVNALLGRLDEELTGVSGALDTVKQLDPEAVNNLLGRIDEIMDTLNRLTPILETLSKWKLFG